MRPLASHVSDVRESAERYHERYYEAEIFRGPSLYFHQRALQTRNSEDFTRHLEYVYATLSSWGMHRMGPGGSKMVPFDIFRGSVEPLRPLIADAAHIDPATVDEQDWTALRELFCRIKVMASGTTIVGNTKVMHHLLPNIIPPIDREYTLLHLRGTKNLANGVDREWKLARDLIANFFIPLVCDPQFAATTASWMGEGDRFPWDTSPMKVVDNLLIGARKSTRAGQAPQLVAEREPVR